MVHSQVTIITPLSFEAQQLRGIASSHRWSVRICGPGAGGVQRFGEQCSIPAGATVILAGLGGGLNPSLQVGDLVVANEVLNGHGVAFTPPLQRPEAGGRVVSSNVICSTPSDKSDLRDRSGADAVDLESGPFAALAEDRGWIWGVLRGISDDASMELPLECSQWTSSKGQLRPMNLAWSVLRQPRLALQLPRLGQHSRMAMGAVAQGLSELLESQSNRPDAL